MEKMRPFVTFAIMLFFKSTSTNGDVCEPSQKPGLIWGLQEAHNTFIYQARAFPLCWKNDPSKLDKFISNHVSSDGKNRFKLLLDDMDQKNSKKNPKHVVPIAKTFDFSIHRIFVPDPFVRNMRQWLRLKITPKSKDIKIVRAIVQAVSSPLGLPFGQFRADVPCEDGVTAFGEGQHDVIPCLYRPKSAFKHPNVYVVWTDDVTTPRDISVSFNYINGVCDEVTAFQFMLAVYGHTPEETYFEMSPVYVLKRRDSVAGFPSPYHAVWKDSSFCNDLLPGTLPCQYPCTFPKPIVDPKHDLNCFTQPCDDRDPMSSYINPTTGRKIIYNAEYDECIENDRGKDGNECPPGPFFCHATRDKAAKENVKIKDKIPNIALETNLTYYPKMTKSWASCPYDPSETCATEFETQINKQCGTRGIAGRSNEDDNDNAAITNNEARRSKTKKHKSNNNKERTTGTSDDLNKEKAFDHLKSKTARRMEEDRNEHGKYMIAAWFVINSISVFMARYYKETGGKRPETANGCCDMRCWLWGHIILGFAFVFLMWDSMIRPMELMHCRAVVEGKSVVNFKALRECIANPPMIVLIHKYVGFAAIALAQLTAIVGWIRPLNPTVRCICTVFHSFSGHVLPYIALVPIFLSNAKWIIKYAVIGLVAENILAHIVASCHQRRVDKRRGLKKKRKQCPILQVVKQHDCVILDTIGLMIHSIVVFSVYGVIFYFYKENHIDSKQSI